MIQRPRDLVQRTFEFARHVRALVNRLPKALSNYEDARQVVRSSGSVAANYIEAQEGVSRKDFFFRIKVCRKEARETGLWLQLLDTGESLEINTARNALVSEAQELKKIFQSIAAKDGPKDAA